MTAITTAPGPTSTPFGAQPAASVYTRYARDVVSDLEHKINADYVLHGQKKPYSNYADAIAAGRLEEALAAAHEASKLISTDSITDNDGFIGLIEKGVVAPLTAARGQGTALKFGVKDVPTNTIISKLDETRDWIDRIVPSLDPAYAQMTASAQAAEKISSEIDDLADATDNVASATKDVASATRDVASKTGDVASAIRYK